MITGLGASPIRYTTARLPLKSSPNRSKASMPKPTNSTAKNYQIGDRIVVLRSHIKIAGTVKSNSFTDDIGRGPGYQIAFDDSYYHADQWTFFDHELEPERDYDMRAVRKA